MRSASEATRQIIEFEELVKRLDRINDLHDNKTTNDDENNDKSVVKIINNNSTILSLNKLSNNFISSLPIISRTNVRQDTAYSYPKCCRDSRDESKCVHVNIGIDEDLQMILEMDPSIVDRYLPSTSLQSTSGETEQADLSSAEHTNVCSMMPNSSNTGKFIERSPRATRPQGWYWNRD